MEADDRGERRISRSQDTEEACVSTTMGGGAQEQEGSALPLAELSVNTRSVSRQNRHKHAVTWSDIGRRLLEQEEAFRVETAHKMDEWMQIEARRLQALIDDGERSRAVMREAMQRYTAVMMEAVDAINKLGDVIQRSFAPPCSQKSTCALHSRPARKRLPPNEGEGYMCETPNADSVSQRPVVPSESNSTSQQAVRQLSPARTLTRSRGRNIKRACVGRPRERYEPY
ncbi:UNVERIFIED_CONTAM: hypothetical protein K2H54_062306 [Gekko kuhli]